MPPPPADPVPGGALTVFESQELKNAVDDGDDDGQRQQVGVGLQQGDLENLGGG